MSIISKDISKAVALLNDGELVAIPTETVYGLAGNIYSNKAVRAIFETKKRPHFNPLIVHIPSIDVLECIVTSIPESAKILADTFWPGPMTMVLKKKSSIPDLITAGKDTVAVRIPKHPLTLELLNRLEFPVAAPSANPFNRISPTRPEHVEGYFKGQIKMVLDGGPCESGLESTIIGFENEQPVIYRLGSTSIEEIEAVVGSVKIKNTKENAPDAPGMLAKHYAPKTKTIVSKSIENSILNYNGKAVGLITFKKRYSHPYIKSQIVLSENGNLSEAASNLYNAMHALDSEGLDIIIAEVFPDEGLGKSINDRLNRATKG